ncbi:Tat pathway signal protein [Lacticaseibacillus brantae]|uniref:Uncharacterized protein n=1 Tax=Lacticaseibacillus brantae DSM 23927 TaxID=1423727 RepID=A0A0R2B9A5_9LACO|nr:Tat pathway signal protein [Lacticaseibacillus brantae]KRM72220.1 hypothetical protein FC34_GL001205 [Lacticaseibacillus brantae DSM 23927]
MTRRSLITGTTTLIGLLIGWYFNKILLCVAVGLAVGVLISTYTNWFKGKK